MNYNASIWLSVYMAFKKLIESLFLRRHQLQFEGFFFGGGESGTQLSSYLHALMDS